MRYLIITINHSHAGLFAYVNFAMNQIIYAETHHLIPVVYFGPKSGTGDNAYYHAQRGDNMWEYYFTPVAGLAYEELQNYINDDSCDITEKDCMTLTTGQLWQLHCNDPKSIYPYPHGMHEHAPIDECWYQQQRAKAYRIMQEYIHVKPAICDKVDAFHDAHFKNHKVLGIHMRGTDKGTAHARPALMRVVQPEEYFQHIDRYMLANGSGKIFVATDQIQFLQKMIDRYGEQVIAYECIRSNSYRSVFEKKDGQGYLKGEQVLIDALLLSRCDFLIKCTSAVGEFALYFNPELKCIDLNHINYDERLFTQFMVNCKRWCYLKFLKYFS